MDAHLKDLRKEIISKIKWDKRINPADFDIVVKNHTVSISGYVDNFLKKEAVLDILHHTPGVNRVYDKVVVLYDYYRTDIELRKIIEKQINELMLTHGEYIDVEVVDGVVKLEGEVYRPRIKGLADSICWELSGVHDCYNFIEVVDRPHESRESISLKKEDDHLSQAPAMGA